VATCLLYVEAALDDAAFDQPEQAERVRHLARRVEGAAHGEPPAPLDAWMEDLYRRVSDRQTLGSVVHELRASLSEVDWAAENAPVLAQQQSWVGQVAARQLRAGQALRQSMVRAPELFKAGAQVRVVVQGPGYAVTAAGQALGAGAVGQSVRVRMENGRIVGGTVADNGSVQVPL